MLSAWYSLFPLHVPTATRTNPLKKRLKTMNSLDHLNNDLPLVLLFTRKIYFTRFWRSIGNTSVNKTICNRNSDKELTSSPHQLHLIILIAFSFFTFFFNKFQLIICYPYLFLPLNGIIILSIYGLSESIKEAFNYSLNQYFWWLFYFFFLCCYHLYYWIYWYNCKQL